MDWALLTAIPVASLLAMIAGRRCARLLRREWWRVRMFRATGQWR